LNSISRLFAIANLSRASSESGGASVRGDGKETTFFFIACLERSISSQR
jgi:hypothetical protein